MTPSRILLLAALLIPWSCGRESAPGGPAADTSWPVRVEPVTDAVPEFDRVVLVTIDTLRADHVSCYGYPRSTTPFLDSLAARGVRFSRAMASVSFTAPSHATMLTGLVPTLHGVQENGARLDPAALDLGKVFGRAGFETAAFLNVKFLAGVAGSFGHVEVCAVGKGRVLSGADVVDAALDWMHAARTSPRFFLWVHLYDPHKWKDLLLGHGPGPIWTGKGQIPVDELLALHGLAPAGDDASYRVDWTVEKNTRSESRSLDFGGLPGYLRCIDAYDELVLFADHQLEFLYRGIEALGLPGKTLWVVTADHGEGLASHGVAGHGARVYQEQLHVPLVLFASDGSLGPRVVDDLVAHVDLFPTLVETLGEHALGAQELFDGRSLWPLVRDAGSVWPERALFAQRRPSAGEEDDSVPGEVYALQTERAKYILHEPGEDERFDLAADPRELLDLGPGGDEAAALRAELERRLRALRAAARESSGEVPREWSEELRALGYAR